MAFVFNEQQKRYMVEIKINGERVYSIRDTYQDFLEQFADIAIPYDQFSPFCGNIRGNRKYGSLNVQRRYSSFLNRNEKNFEAVRQLIEERCEISVRYAQQELDLSYGTCRRFLKYDLHFHSHRLHATLEMLPLDRPKRQNFCQYFNNRFVDNDGSIDKLMFTNESWCHPSG